MGLGSSTGRLEEKLPPSEEKYLGLENFGNTCYVNSVVQALYFCKPFREECIEHFLTRFGTPPAFTSFEAPGREEETILSSLGELFATMNTYKKRTGVIAPTKFVRRLKMENELFNNFMHQDAHEFFNFLLDDIGEELKRHNHRSKKRTESVWVRDIFEGVLTNALKCLCCETVTSRDETFLDLSLEVEANVSLSHCLRNFSGSELMGGGDKFFCDSCCSLQEARKCMQVKTLPNVLALHLKRFKYFGHLGRFTKLPYRVVFPFELKIPNPADDADDSDRLFDLFAVVVHIGSGPNHGHYISLIKSDGCWLIFDDDAVDMIEESQISSFFGSVHDQGGTSETGYLLFYQSREYLIKRDVRRKQAHAQTARRKQAGGRTRGSEPIS